MNEIEKEFVLLAANENTITSGQLKTRALQQQLNNEPIRVGTDESGQRHLLVPATDHVVRSDHSAAGVSISSRPMLIGADSVDFVDIHCHIPHLNGVFERLAQDVSTRLEHDGSNPPQTCLQVLAEWRELLKNVGRPMARETVEGLIGELTVLARILGQSPSAALDAWVGPQGALHDFVSGNDHLEVKSTASLDGKVVAISSLDQMDPAGHSLTLAVVHIQEDPTAPDLDALVEALTNLGVPRHALTAKLHQAGYVVGSKSDADLHFTVKSVRVWSVGDDFPGLRRSHIPSDHLKGVGRVRYELHLDTAPDPWDEASATSILESWTTTGGALI